MPHHAKYMSPRIYLSDLFENNLKQKYLEAFLRPEGPDCAQTHCAVRSLLNAGPDKQWQLLKL